MLLRAEVEAQIEAATKCEKPFHGGSVEGA